MSKSAGISARNGAFKARQGQVQHGNTGRQPGTRRTGVLFIAADAH
jgi:hypothetical protein